MKINSDFITLGEALRNAKGGCIAYGTFYKFTEFMKMKEDVQISHFEETTLFPNAISFQGGSFQLGFGERDNDKKQIIPALIFIFPLVTE